MLDSLLTTKLFIPPLHSGVITRPRLVNDLLKDMHRRLTLISAPAGFGKTTLLNEWVQAIRSKKEDISQVAWLTLDEDDNDLMRFFTYFIAALRTANPSFGEGLLEGGQMVSALPIEPFMISLINQINNHFPSAEGKPPRLVLILDDYHLINAQPVHEAIAFLIKHQPPSLHLVLATRADPPLPLARLRAHGQINELRAAELRFTQTEMALFFQSTLGITFSPEDIDTLETRTEGWAAALQLLALTLEAKILSGSKPSDLIEFVNAFSGDNEYIADYLTGEVLNHQPEAIRNFLMHTSILQRMCGDLCVAVSGQPDSQTILEELKSTNLFIIPLDDERRWYRYHTLFLDLLRQRLGQTDPHILPELHRRASLWYETHHMLDEAIYHALQERNTSRAANLIEVWAPTVLMSGEVSTLIARITALPEELLNQKPELHIYYAWALLIAGEHDAAEKRFDTIESQLGIEDFAQFDSSHPQQELIAQIIAAHAYIAMHHGDFKQSIWLARLLMERFSAQTEFVRSLSNWIFGLSYYLDLDINTADQAFLRVIESGKQTGNMLLTMMSINVLGVTQMLKGNFHKAQRAFEQGLHYARHAQESTGQKKLPLTVSVIYQGLGDLARRKNDLKLANMYLEKCLELSELWGHPEVLADTYVAIGHLRYSQQNLNGMEEIIAKITKLIEDRQVSPMTIRNLEAARLRFLTLCGKLEHAELLARQIELSRTEPPYTGNSLSVIMDFVEQTSLAWLDLTQKRYQTALERTSSLQQAAVSNGLQGVRIEPLVLQAQALSSLGRENEALDILEEALNLSMPEEQKRVFVDCGRTVQEMLVRLTQKRSLSAPLRSFAMDLLGIFSDRRDSELAAPALLPQHDQVLSEREMEVLHWIATGLSNDEIASQLCLAISTVKTHTRKIYQKLGVTKRTQAIARARELKLIH
ncbi:MAG: hypothetical protein HPY45_07825 [Anaerolineae bacterium]|nr:hypothetical protein [Anaerolineae bacterium]